LHLTAYSRLGTVALNTSYIVDLPIIQTLAFHMLLVLNDMRPVLH
jgi:hypothetical protein